MTTSPAQPQPNRDKTPPDTDPAQSSSRQIAAVVEMIGLLSRKVSALERRARDLADTGAAGSDTPDNEQPRDWVWLTPPEVDPDPRTLVHAFVAWYNATYISIPGGGNRPIPSCWAAHPALAMEIATLAYTWRAANLGESAVVVEAQRWHHQWRPGFAARLADWMPRDCFDGAHSPDRGTSRPDRFTLAEQAEAR